MAIYGAIEHQYCEPVAEELARNTRFASWFLSRAGQSGWSETFRALRDEQARMRTSGLYWWKNVFCPEGTCSCPDLRGREVDITIVFERPDHRRIGLHIECKHPKDKFRPGQAQRYRDRLKCWTQSGKGPRTIPHHEEAVAILICSRNHRHRQEDTAPFNGIIFFDEIAQFIADYPAS